MVLRRLCLFRAHLSEGKTGRVPLTLHKAQLRSSSGLQRVRLISRWVWVELL